jgi:hypothetical protein
MQVYDIIKSFNSEKEIHEFNSMAILNDKGQRLFDIELNKDGTLSVTTNGTVMVDGVILDSTMLVEPKYNNYVVIHRAKYGTPK